MAGILVKDRGIVILLCPSYFNGSECPFGNVLANRFDEALSSSAGPPASSAEQC
jgi:hypothetical protein